LPVTAVHFGGAGQPRLWARKTAAGWSPDAARWGCARGVGWCARTQPTRL